MELKQEEAKNTLFICNCALLLKIYKKNPINDFSFSFLLEQIFNYLNQEQNSSILLSYQGNQKGYKTVELIKNIPSVKNLKVYSYDSTYSTDISLDLIALKKFNINYLIKIIVSKKNDSISIKIFNSQTNDYLDNLQLQQIYDSYQNDSKTTIDNMPFEPTIEFLNLKNLIIEQASKNEILKDFVNVKPRYISNNIAITNDDYTTELLSELFRNYAANFLIKKDNLFSKINTLWYSIFRTDSSVRKGYQSIINIDAYSNLIVNLFLDLRLKKLNLNEIVLIYLDFLIEELKRSQTVNIKNLFVLVSPNVSYQLLDLLKQYGLKYYFYNHSNLTQKINDENCLFAYTFDQVNGNPRYSKQLNNFYFLICLVWMLNSYTNRNNLLSFKYNQLCENFGKIQYKKQIIKFDDELIPDLVSLITNNYHQFKDFNQIKVFKFWTHDKYALLRLYSTKKRHAIIIYYDYTIASLVIEYQMCYQYNKETFPWRFDLFKYKLNLNKWLKNVKSKTENIQNNQNQDEIESTK
ncbi:MAG5620 family putative phospho-sugar mutase [Mycoplasmopsis primatum]|uniref:MAG5620 family putative phospho-sugar mutase n=1 Tax=Mycoplasmopsis primatum TaxID=55604 RepID=UPI000A46A1C7|nr:hypothetical protein [Mycoplasmopsis primatum]